MDGVLIDTNSVFVLALRNLFTIYGKDPNSLVYNLADYTGKKNIEIAQILIDNFHFDSTAEIVEQQMEESYQLALKTVDIVPFPNLIDLLYRIKQCGYRTALATGSNIGWTRQVLHALKIEDYFETVVTGEEVTHGKPNPEIYQKAADRINTDPKECIVVEDSPNGIRAAQAIGMHTIAYKGQPDFQDTSMADEEYEDFALIDPNNYL